MISYFKKALYALRLLISYYYKWTDTDMYVSCKKSI